MATRDMDSAPFLRGAPLWFVAVGLGAFGCGDVPGPLLGTVDASPDAAVPTADAGRPDGGALRPDGGLLDASMMCAAPFELCGGVCVDTRTQVEHCGGCNSACVSELFCVDARCVSPEVTGLAPMAGSTRGGGRVVFSGSGLDLPTEIEARFDGILAAVTERSSTSLTVVAPPRLGRPGLVEVRLSSPEGWRLDLSDAYLYELAPLRFRSAARVEVGNDLQGLAAADFDLDGRVDVAAIAAADEQLFVFSGGAAGLSSPDIYPVTESPIALRAHDLDGDGDAELVVTSGSAQPPISVFPNRRALGFGPAVEHIPGQQMRGDLDFGDFDEDGAVDVVAGGRTNWVYARGNGQAGLVQGGLRGSGRAGTRGVKTADLDDMHDTHDDVLVINAQSYALEVYFGRGDGSFGHEASYDVGGTGGEGQIVVADLNADGHQDVATTTGGGVQVLFGDGSGRLAAPVRYLSATGSPSSVEAADMDGDGDLELLVGQRGGRALTLLVNRGDGSFEAREIALEREAPRHVVAADIDGDGHLDLVVTDVERQGPDGVSVLLSEPR